MSTTAINRSAANVGFAPAASPTADQRQAEYFVVLLADLWRTSDKYDPQALETLIGKLQRRFYRRSAEGHVMSRRAHAVLR